MRQSTYILISCAPSIHKFKDWYLVSMNIKDHFSNVKLFMIVGFHESKDSFNTVKLFMMGGWVFERGGKELVKALREKGRVSTLEVQIRGE